MLLCCLQHDRRRAAGTAQDHGDLLQHDQVRRHPPLAGLRVVSVRAGRPPCMHAAIVWQQPPLRLCSRVPKTHAPSPSSAIFGRYL